MTLTLGYLVPEFPSQTHAFFWREAEGLTAAGLHVAFLSTRAPRDDTSRHAFTDEARARTTYLVPPRGLRALARLVAAPRRTVSALRYIAGLRESPATDRLRALPLLVAAAELVAVARDRRIDHLHVHSFANAAHVAALARRLGGPPYSLTLHGDLPVYGRDHAAKLAGAAFVTAVTAPLAATLAPLVPHLRPVVLSMGVDPDRFSPGTPPADGPLRLLTVARLNYVKGHVHLLAAMADLVARGHDLHLTIAGDGPYRPEIEARIVALNLGPRVTLTGPVSEDRVRDLLRASHALALTSFGQGEAAPVAVMEAMACGLPVICSRIGGTADMIEDGVDGLLVPQQDEPAIAAAIEALTDPATRARLGAAARARAVAQFDYRAKARQLADLIRASRP